VEAGPRRTLFAALAATAFAAAGLGAWALMAWSWSAAVFAIWGGIAIGIMATVGACRTRPA
jgi:hypothetical protein